MTRITVNLSDERHRALKETALRRRTTMGKIIDESLERAGVKTEDEGLSSIRGAQRDATLAEDETRSLALAIEETRRVNRGE